MFFLPNYIVYFVQQILIDESILPLSFVQLVSVITSFLSTVLLGNYHSVVRLADLTPLINTCHIGLFAGHGEGIDKSPCHLHPTSNTSSHTTFTQHTHSSICRDVVALSYYESLNVFRWVATSSGLCIRVVHVSKRHKFHWLCHISPFTLTLPSRALG